MTASKSTFNNRNEKRPQQSKGRGSKYAKKVNGRSPMAKAKVSDPVYDYFVEGTDIRATKTPCERSAQDRQAKKYSQSGLGTWKNPLTGKKVKVRRAKRKGGAEIEAAA